MSSTAILSQGVGYGVVLGIGFFFAFLMVGLTRLQARYTAFKPTSLAEFASASHSVKPGMIGCAIVSSWTWAATLLQSSAMGYKTGICGPYAYAAGATVQIFLFALNASKIKLNAPKAHVCLQLFPFFCITDKTFLEVIRVRWGKLAHFVFMFFSLATSTIVSASDLVVPSHSGGAAWTDYRALNNAVLVTGGSDTVASLTGASTRILKEQRSLDYPGLSSAAICMLVPLGVIVYVLIGGLRASILADYIHTAFLFAIILTFQFCSFDVYTTSDKIGSPRKMYDLLLQAGQDYPIDGNLDGSYLTFRSKTGMIFMVINLIGNFGTVFNMPPNSDQAYWQRAIASQPSTAVKGYMIVRLYLLAALLGSPLPTTETDLIYPFSIPLGFASTMGLSAAVLRTNPSYPNYPEGLSAAEVSAGLPAAAAAQTLLGAGGAAMLLVLLFLAVTSAASAELCAVSTVFSYDVYTTYINPNASEKRILFVDHCAIVAYYPMLTGNVLSIGVSAIICTVGSLIWPENYDFEETRRLHTYSEASEEIPPSPTDLSASLDENEKSKQDFSPSTVDPAAIESANVVEAHMGDSPQTIERSFKFARIVAITMFIILMILIPVPLATAGGGYISSYAGFECYVVITIMWVFLGAFLVVLYPIWEYRHSLAELGGNIWADVRGKRIVASS
ncbi:SPOSA6832_03140 [Sporobolomyces salmonicolor]|uniref:SPOSA6832_03140-mRNA-1:cds n=1 Tax=Sporidiobolus salmonicolor TaxID=5005 RepID=A0A0D6ENS1_SPOSA|nr:SPOSA6832_03140 [Sporobolomyces salmonicolor]